MVPAGRPPRHRSFGRLIGGREPTGMCAGRNDNRVLKVWSSSLTIPRPMLPRKSSLDSYLVGIWASEPALALVQVPDVLPEPRNKMRRYAMTIERNRDGPGPKEEGPRRTFAGHATTPGKEETGEPRPVLHGTPTGQGDGSPPGDCGVITYEYDPRGPLPRGEAHPLRRSRRRWTAQNPGLRLPLGQVCQEGR